MKYKVCGINSLKNLSDLLKMKLDFIGLIFYADSARNCTMSPELVLDQWKTHNVATQKVGVFVNSELDFVINKTNEYKLDYIQLHGKETPEFCQKMKAEGIKIIKAISINSNYDFNDLIEYDGFVNYFLFDTKGKLPGGNGIQFDWELLKEYKLNIPYFLSGGIGPEDQKKLAKLTDQRCYCIDVNSKFEIAPGLKNTTSIKLFINLQS